MNKRIISFLLVGTFLSACSSTAPMPDLPRMPGNMRPPPMPAYVPPPPPPPPPPKDGIVRNYQRVGTAMTSRAGRDRVYKLTVGVGDFINSFPDIKWIELPRGVIFHEAICDSPMSFVGTADSPRNPQYMLAVKPQALEMTPRTTDCSLVTNEGRYQVRINIVHGNSRGTTTLRLEGGAPDNGPSGNPANRIAPEALCQDNAFSWQRTAWWAPMSVCATPTQTIITMPPNAGQSMPVVHAASSNGWSVVNSQVSGTTIRVQNIHPAIRLTVGAESIDIVRGGY